MKNALAVLGTLALAGSAFAAGPFAVSVGAGDGSLVIAPHATRGIYSSGYILGDTATFDPGVPAAGSTIWKSFFLLRNDTDSQNFWADNVGGTHLPVVPDGTVTNNATSVSNTGFSLGGAQTGSVVVTISAPVAGDTARINWAWTINNGAGTAKNYRLIWHFDADSYVGGTNYDDDLVARTNSGLTAGKVLGIGENNGSGSVDLNSGMLMECDKVVTSYFGLSNNNGPSNWWSNVGSYAGNGPEVTNSIPAIYANKIEGDADNNFLADAGLDSGGALQVDVAVPASGSTTVNFSATWGVNQVLGPDPNPSGVEEWSLFD